MNPPKRPNLITALVTACLLPCALSSCVVTTVEKLAPDLSPRRVETKARWDVIDGGRVVGQVKLLDILDPRGTVTMYHVTYPDGQQAGWIDMHGRAYRDEPFHEGLVLVGMDTMVESLKRLLDLETPPAVLPTTESDKFAQK